MFSLRNLVQPFLSDGCKELKVSFLFIKCQVGLYIKIVKNPTYLFIKEIPNLEIPNNYDLANSLVFQTHKIDPFLEKIN